MCSELLWWTIREIPIWFTLENQNEATEAHNSKESAEPWANQGESDGYDSGACSGSIINSPSERSEQLQDVSTTGKLMWTLVDNLGTGQWPHLSYLVCDDFSRV